MIVLNETTWVEEALKSPEFGDQPFERFRRIARYYLDSGYTDDEVRDKLDMYLIMCDPTASLVKWADFLDNALSIAKRRALVDVNEVTVTKSEMDILETIKQKQARRLAFTLLCLAKYWTAVNQQQDYWVADSDSEIMKLANIKTSVKKQSKMFHDLYEMGLLEFSKRVDNTSVRVTFVDDESEPVLHIDDFRNLGYQYMQYTGVDCVQCDNCGLIMRAPSGTGGRPLKYCGRCAVEIASQQKAEWMRKQREIVTKL